MNKNQIKAYESDASRLKGNAKDVKSPSTITEIRGIVASNQRIVPRGSGTGLAGGAVPQQGLDVVLELTKLDKITALDKGRMTIVVEAGVILDELQGYLAPRGLEFPVNPSSHAVASIGGMIATDAVGSRAMKYGRTSNWVKWIEVIDGQGNLLRKGATELSDYSGMEGITGVIVKACLKLEKKKLRTASLIEIETLSEVIPMVRHIKQNRAVSMIEFIDKKISEDLELKPKYHLIVEYENDTGSLKGEAYQKILAMRDRIYPLIANEGYIRIEDPKILLDRFEKLMTWLESKNIPTFGHLSVGIVHPCFNHDQEKLIPELMKLVKRLCGQISGEHGIGILKKSFVDPNDKKIIINVKKRTDPLNKFNVGKII